MKYLDSKQEYWYNENGYLCYRRNPLAHGGHSEEHRREMMQIAEQVVAKKLNDVIPEIRRVAYSTAYNDLVKELSFDVESVVNIGFANGEAIFKDKKTQKVVADAIMKEVYKHLRGMK